jgi:hypothetical protein
MRNGQLKADNNIHMGIEDQCVWFAVHQRPGEPGYLILHPQEVKQKLGSCRKTSRLTAHMAVKKSMSISKMKGVNTYVKDNIFHQETNPRYKPTPLLMS